MFGFLIAVIAGGVTPMIERPVARPLVRALAAHVAVVEGEVRALAFMIAMIVAGTFCAAFDTGTPLSLALGGALGYFGVRLLRWGQREIDNRRA